MHSFKADLIDFFGNCMTLHAGSFIGTLIFWNDNCAGLTRPGAEVKLEHAPETSPVLFGHNRDEKCTQKIYSTESTSIWPKTYLSKNKKVQL